MKVVPKGHVQDFENRFVWTFWNGDERDFVLKTLFLNFLAALEKVIRPPNRLKKKVIQPNLCITLTLNLTLTLT